jgi:hypothetical protein
MNRLHKINPEEIAYWFFRLNGCTTITNFVVHPDRRGSQRTDVDVLAVRFPYRAELLTSSEPMVDHSVFTTEQKTEIIFAEVKHGLCRLNGPWTNPSSENMHRVLYALGTFENWRVPSIARSIYQEGFYTDEVYRVRLFAVGDRINQEIISTAIQLLWDDVLFFIFDRFSMYLAQKAHHNQWDRTGRLLYKLSSRCTREEFIATVKKSMQNYLDVGSIHRTDSARGKL